MKNYRITAQEVELPCSRTLRNNLNELGYRLHKVKAFLPLKNNPLARCVL